MSRVQRLVTGDAAEFLVCHDLASRGFRVAISPFENAPYDILCERNGKFLRVQVKGTLKSYCRKVNGMSYYQFNLGNLNCDTFDIIALAALDVRHIHYFTSEQAKAFSTSKYISLSDMGVSSTEVLDSFGAFLVQS